jgi:tripartite-type tricarboxylate transporter receptor subunit TctC
MPNRPVTRRRFNTTLLAGSAATLAAPALFAQASWPNKPIRLIVPYTPGGFTDVTARLVAQKLQERLGQPVTIDNKPGANSIIGVDLIAKAPPDGSTFGVVIAAFSANTSLYPKLPYDPKKDLAAVSLIGISPLVAAVNNDAPFKTAAELVAYAKRNPGKLSFAFFKAVTGSFMVHIPYRGAAPALTDLMGGQVQLFFDAASGLLNPGKTGKVRLIGVASDRRLAAAPELPTFIEQGIAGFTGSTWAGMLAPSGTPKDIVRRMADEVARIVRLDDVKARLEAMGTIPVGGTPEEFDSFITAETAKWGKVIRDAKVTAD